MFINPVFVNNKNVFYERTSPSQTQTVSITELLISKIEKIADERLVHLISCLRLYNLLITKQYIADSIGIVLDINFKDWTTAKIFYDHGTETSLH